MHLRRGLLLLVASLSLTGIDCVFAQQATLDTFSGCSLEGTAKSQCGQTLNRLKNRYHPPPHAAINPAITLNAILQEGDDLDRWKVTDAAELVGFVASVEPGGKQESCNCARTDLQDIHINVVRTPEDVGTLTRYFIVEITPRMKSLHPTWTYARVRKLTGKWVKFRGWMLFDTMHEREAQNTRDRPRQGCAHIAVKEIWRATGWEIHPVTSFEALPGPP